MNDWRKVLIDWLAGSPDVVTTFGNRIYAGIDPPHTYDPADGPALLIDLRGGSQDYTSQVWDLAVQMVVFGRSLVDIGVASETIYNVLNDKVFGNTYGHIIEMRLDMPTRFDKENDTGRLYGFTFYDMKFRRLA